MNDELIQHLRRSDGQEDVCFALWRPSTGATRTTGLVVSVVLPEDEGDRTVHGNVEFHDQFLLRALARASENKCGLAVLHSHPASGYQRLSTEDQHAESGIAGAAFAATGLPLVGATLGAADSFWSARFWKRTAPRRYEPEWCGTVRVVGCALDAFFDNTQIPLPEFREDLRRTFSAWGPSVQQKLMRLHYGVVGAGSVGSIICETLARMGAQHVTVMDFDSLQTLNLDRTLNASGSDARRHRSKVEVAVRAFRKHATGGTIVAEGVEHSVVELAGYRTALDCDVLFSCVDRPWPRFILNSIAYAHLIPVIDGGIIVETKGGGKRLKRAAWRAHTVAPGRGCLECIGQYDPADVSLEMEGKLDDPVYIQGLPIDHHLRRNENVFPFSVSVAGLEILQALAMIVAPLGVANIGGKYYDFATGRTDDELTECKPHCPFREFIAVGDAVPVLPAKLHEAAECARRSRREKQRKPGWLEGLGEWITEMAERRLER